MWDGWLTFFAILRISSLRVSACQLAVLETLSVKMKGRNGTNNVKGLTNHLHNIFSASKLQGKEIDMEDSFIIPSVNRRANGPDCNDSEQPSNVKCNLTYLKKQWKKRKV